MRRTLLGRSSQLGAAGGIVLILFACSSNDDTAEPEAIDGGDATVVESGPVDAGRRDADADTGADVDEGEFVVPDASVVCETTPCVKRLFGSSSNYCALLDDGRVSCWGENSSGQIGEDPELHIAIPSPKVIPGIVGITDIGINGQNVCARLGDGSVHCWGDAQLINTGSVPPDGGDPSYDAVLIPQRLDAIPAAKSIAMGLRFACVTVGDGSLTCWGSNDRRQLGRGATTVEIVPPEKAKLLTQDVVSVIAGEGRTFVIAPDGDVLSWGANTQYGNENFMLGRDTSEDPNENPTIVPALTRVRGLSTGYSHSCAVTGRFVQCWGANSNGQLGRGTYDYAAYEPARTRLADVTDAEDLDGGKTEHDVPIQVTVSAIFSCAALGSGRVYCWGNPGQSGVLGKHVKADKIQGTPTRIDGFGGAVVGIASTNNSACALLRSGAVECWGSNERGELGVGAIDYDPHPSPTRVRFTQ